MITAAALLTYAVLVATAGAALLRGAVWPGRVPLVGIAAWHALCLSIVGAVVLASIALTVRLPSISGDVAAVLHACAVSLRTAYATPAGSVATTAGIAASAALLARTSWSVGRALVEARRKRQHHRQILALLARRDPRLGVMIVEHHSPAAYCLPGRGQGIVVTSAALARLTEDQLQAVVAHERGHVRGRHHLIVDVATGLSQALPWLPAFRWSAEQVRRLVEMAADDAARTGSSSSTLASALLTLAGSASGTPATSTDATPVATLAAADHIVEVRLRRLGEVVPAAGGWQRIRFSSVAALLLAAPLVIAAAPAIIVAALDYCLVG